MHLIDETTALKKSLLRSTWYATLNSVNTAKFN